MALMLPDSLTEALQYLGYEWPSSNEDILRANGDAFRATAQDAETAIEELRGALNHIVGHNASDVTRAFEDYLRGSESNLSSLEDYKEAAELIGDGFDLMGAAVVTLKGVVIAQLVLLAAAIAAAIVSCGLAAAAPIVAREGAKRLIDAAINAAIEEVLG